MEKQEKRNWQIILIAYGVFCVASWVWLFAYGWEMVERNNAEGKVNDPFNRFALVVILLSNPIAVLLLGVFGAVMWKLIEPWLCRR